MEPNMRLSTFMLSAAVLTATWHVAIPAANAQNQTPSPDISSPPSNISEQKLDAAATALQRVTILRQEYAQKLAVAPTDADKERIIAEANNALTKAVGDQGLTVEEFSSIMRMAQNDPDLRGKILQRLNPSPEDRQ
jgi:hypothetical protein